MKKNNPNKLSLSIIIPVYNGADVMGDTIKSILSQDYKDFDLILVNDCSTDNSEEVIKSFKDPRIKYFKNEKNLGYSRNIESCRLFYF